jgi:hypothetical protein
MKLRIKTSNIEIEYTDEYSIIEEVAKKRIIDLLDKIYEEEELLNNNKAKCKYCGGEDKGQ